MYEFVKSLLPKEVLDITDVNQLRDLREFFDDRVQEEKQKQGRESTINASSFLRQATIFGD
jgi:hypothetical protein